MQQCDGCEGQHAAADHKHSIITGSPSTWTPLQSDRTTSFLLDRTSSAGSVVASFVAHGAEAAAVEEGPWKTLVRSRPPLAILILLIIAHIYFDSTIPLWMRLYREGQLADQSASCVALWSKFEQLGSGRTEAEVDDEDLLGGRRYTDPNCAWYITQGPDSSWVRVPHTFTKGAALSVQALMGTVLFYLYNLFEGGREQLRQCLRWRGLLSFAPIGSLFGLTAVFGFLAQDALSPGSYALYAQTGVVIIPCMWSIVFRKALPVLTWIHIVLIATGIVAYRMSELDLNESLFSGVGILWIGCKVVAGGIATIWAEAFLKSDTSVPFAVQASYIMPWKVVSTLLTIYVLPPHGLPSDRPGGFFHDWSFLTIFVIFNNLGDTFTSALVAKLFDSVVKSVCGVVGIIFPTWIVSLMLGWETIAPGTLGGQMKAFGGIVVVLGSFAYVIGRHKAKQEEQSLSESARARILSEGNGNLLGA